MTRQDRINAIYRRIEDCVARESWREARQGLREFARLLIDATIASDDEQVALIDESVAQIFSDLSLDDAFEPELTLNSLGWSADGIREVSQMARKRRPPMTSAQRAAVLQDAETRILDLLGKGNGGPRSNREIASELDLNVATVARTLSALRAKGKVHSWPEGRFMMNRLASPAAGDLPMGVSNARALNQEGTSDLTDIKNSAPRNSGLPLVSRLLIRSGIKQQLNDFSGRVNQPNIVNMALFERGKLVKMMPQGSNSGIEALREARVGEGDSDSGVLNNDDRLSYVVEANSLPFHENLISKAPRKSNLTY